MGCDCCVISVGQTSQSFCRCLAVIETETGQADKGVVVAIGCGVWRKIETRPRLAVAGAKGESIKHAVQVNSPFDFKINMHLVYEYYVRTNNDLS